MGMGGDVLVEIPEKRRIMHPQPVPVPRCPRCHGEHPPRVAMPFAHPVGEFPGWLTCPATFEPVLVRVVRLVPAEGHDEMSAARRKHVAMVPVYELV